MSSLNKLCKKGFKGLELVTNMVFRDTVEQNKDRRIVSGAQYLSGHLRSLRLTLHQVLQLGIVYNPAFTKQYLKERLEKRVTNKEVKESVQDRSKVYPTWFLYSQRQVTTCFVSFEHG